MPETLISCEGGLDLRSAALSAPKGSLSACYNFEKDQGPGYVKRPGWVRCDGRVTGPEMDSALILQFSSLSITGSFLYGEQVRLQASTGALAGVQVNAIVIGFQGGNGFLILAYPVTTFTKAIDLTQLALSGTTVLGLASGAQITALQSSKLLNDSTISVAQYDAYRQAVHTQHAAAVLRVPGRLESPVDAIFSFSNAIYSVHDCPIFKFSNGASATTIPQEGHVIRSQFDRPQTRHDPGGQRRLGRLARQRRDGGRDHRHLRHGHQHRVAGEHGPARSLRCDQHDAAAGELLPVRLEPRLGRRPVRHARGALFDLRAVRQGPP
jgi:hypothetical protein